MNREKCLIEYERSHTSARRMLTLTVIVVLGVLLGYSRASDLGPPIAFTAGSIAP